MSDHGTIAIDATDADRRGCDRPGNITRSMLGYGVIAGPLYLVVGIVEALTRNGFDLARHDLSLLANGSLGWIHITLLILTGLMTVTAAIGARRALVDGRAATWGPRLLVGYGLGLVGAGVFVADPMFGFPLGTPEGPATTITASGTLHFVCGALGFVCLIAATFVFARRFAAQRQTGLAQYSRVTSVVFLAGFVGIASGSNNPLIILGFWIAVTAGWAWLAVVSVHLYRGTRR
jgi:hypothetical protein